MKAVPRTILYGGDYYPEQWPQPVWEDDYAAFDQAGINTLTINVFSWAQLEPAERTYDFSTLDRIVERLESTGRHMVLATSTGAMPAWLATEYPEVLRVDFEGRWHGYGQRHNACPNSRVFQKRSAALASRLAEQYGNSPALVAWHVGNEYGGACYCGACTGQFRNWLMNRYGTLDALNAAWNTSFWSHTFTTWDQILAPTALTEHWRGEDHTAFQGITLDYRRFMTDSLLGCYLEEKQAIRKYDAETPVTTNFMGMYRGLDYFRWSDQLDLAAWDNYPPTMHSEARMALAHDLTRGLKGGQPFWVMEQTPSRTAARDVNPVKRPGVMRLWSWQAVAHGADAVMFFQMRASRGACEKYHGAVIDHTGRTDSRVFREVAGLGAEFAALGDLTIGARTPARTALIWDWDSWWAWEMTDGINRHLTYIDTVLSYYRAWWALGADIDVVPMDADLTRYDVVLAPLAHMVKGDLVERLAAVASRGGTVVTGLLSGRVDESDNAILCTAGSPLAELAGLQIEEIDAAEPGDVVGVRFGPAVAGAGQGQGLVGSPDSGLPNVLSVGTGSVAQVSPDPDPAQHVDAVQPMSYQVPPASGPVGVPYTIYPGTPGIATMDSTQDGPAQTGTWQTGAGPTVSGPTRAAEPTGFVPTGMPSFVSSEPGSATGNGWAVPETITSGSLVMEVVTPLAAEVLATYTQQFYAGTPAVTRRTVGSGQVIYIATLLDEPGMDIIAGQVADHHRLASPYPARTGIEVTRRTASAGELLFILNHNDTPVVLPAHTRCQDQLSRTDFAPGDAMEVPPKGVRVLLEVR